ncbi:hypothetical protein [Mycolicibacterium llatzerense]|uniref:hypothetical protein n=1 Tax=Mycolicibacterium llatzerense TaxID=280871 RepID=UPI0008DD22CF|nr:hypothetical protein [Mycolicibacterium llatzerense]
MGEIELLLAANGGVASAVQLREMGWSHRQIKKQGWQPLRRGWYATPSADPQVGDGHLGPVTTSAVAKVRQLRSSDPIPSPPRSIGKGTAGGLAGSARRENRRLVGVARNLRNCFSNQRAHPPVLGSHSDHRAMDGPIRHHPVRLAATPGR